MFRNLNCTPSAPYAPSSIACTRSPKQVTPRCWRDWRRRTASTFIASGSCWTATWPSISLRCGCGIGSTLTFPTAFSCRIAAPAFGDVAGPGDHRTGVSRRTGTRHRYASPSTPGRLGRFAMAPKVALRPSPWYVTQAIRVFISHVHPGAKASAHQKVFKPASAHAWARKGRSGRAHTPALVRVEGLDRHKNSSSAEHSIGIPRGTGSHCEGITLHHECGHHGFRHCQSKVSKNHNARRGPLPQCHRARVVRGRGPVARCD